MRSSLDVAVIADHHGAFVTASSVVTYGKKTIVVDPAKQKKYAENPRTLHDGNFMRSLAEAFPGWNVVMGAGSDIVDILRSSGRARPTLVLGAGTVMRRLPKDGAFEGIQMASSNPLSYLKDKRLSMYSMLGIATQPDARCRRSFYVDTSWPDPVEADMPAGIVERSDPLIGTAFSASDTLTHGARLRGACAFDVWSSAIASVQPVENYIAYPYDLLAAAMTPVRRFIPAATCERIQARAEETAKWKGLVEWAGRTYNPLADC